MPAVCQMGVHRRCGREQHQCDALTCTRKLEQKKDAAESVSQGTSFSSVGGPLDGSLFDQHLGGMQLGTTQTLQQLKRTTELGTFVRD
jgi:hypothetical protein